MAQVVGAVLGPVRPTKFRVICTIPPYREAMSLRKLLFYLLIAFGVFFLIQSPRQAAELVQSLGENAGDWFSVAGRSLAKFLSELG